MAQVSGVVQVVSVCRRCRCSGSVEQVLGGGGAGGAGFWRRCAFGMGTCAANVVSARSSGAGTTSFSTPAPLPLGTCASGVKGARTGKREGERGVKKGDEGNMGKRGRGGLRNGGECRWGGVRNEGCSGAWGGFFVHLEELQK